MKQLKNSLVLLYRFWFVLSLILVVSEIHFFDASKWNLLLPFMVLVMFMFISFTKPCSTLRRVFALWVFYKPKYVDRIKKLDSALLSYPLLIWIECSGQDVFINGGFFGVNDGLIAHVNGMSKGISSILNDLKA
jgi:hypothetical protein